MIRLDGKVAIVTGATGSIGEYIARGLHAAGAKVFVTGIADDGGEEVAKSLGEGAIFRHVDVTSDEDIEACLADAKARFGRLDILVNCACSYLDNGLKTSRGDWLKALDVNIVGPAVFVQKAAAHLTQPGGVVVNIGSVSGKFGNGTRGPYSAGKAALMHFTRCAAVALAPQGIRVVTVSPGWTWSPPMEVMTGNDREAADRAGKNIHPLGRVGRMEEVANIVTFACSDEASWLNGCDVPADGGFAALGPDQGRGPVYWINATRPS